MPEDPIGRLVRNLLALQRIGNGVTAEARKLQTALFDSIVEDLRRIDPTGPGAERYQKMRTEKFIESVRGRLRDHAPAMEKLLKDQLAPIGRQQAVYAQQTLVATLGSVGEDLVRQTPITQQRMRAILNSEPFRGKILKEHTQRMSANVLDRVRTEIRLGMQAEESIPDLVRRIKGPRVLGRTVRETEALVRTAVTHVSNAGMMGTFQDNEQILAGLRFTAALDDRTTEICLSLDGEIFKLDDSRIPEPPLHWNCRSALVPEPDWKGLGMEPPSDGPRAVRDTSTIAEEDLDRRVSARRRTGDLGRASQVSSNATATQWLKDQPAHVQDKMLGRGKAQLFRDGKITLKDLVRRDNSVVPLSELAG